VEGAGRSGDDDESQAMMPLPEMPTTTFSLGMQATLEGITGLTDEAALVTNGNLMAA
jgi:hypothetical protein